MGQETSTSHNILIKRLSEIHKNGNIYHNKLFAKHGLQICPFLKLYARAICEGNSEIVEILAPAMDNPNAAGLFTYRSGNTVLLEKLTPIRLAVQGGSVGNYSVTQSIYEKHCIIPMRHYGKVSA